MFENKSIRYGANVFGTEGGSQFITAYSLDDEVILAEVDGHGAAIKHKVMDETHYNRLSLRDAGEKGVFVNGELLKPGERVIVPITEIPVVVRATNKKGILFNSQPVPRYTTELHRRVYPNKPEAVLSTV